MSLPDGLAQGVAIDFIIVVLAFMARAAARVIIVVGNGRPCGQCHKQDKDIANDIAPHRAGVSGWLVDVTNL